MTICPYCAQEVPEAKFPWRFQRHDIHGNSGANGAASLCVGSRNIYTLAFLGLREIEPEHIPKESTGFTSSYPYGTTRKVAS